MEKFLVGGAVRDFLLKLPIKERDWVVTGSSPQEMLKIGYEQVGKDFPVFLHPKNHEEYALARTESKSGQGYTGFTCYTSSLITIEEDLYRRDLTINAMAFDMYGNLLDPYNGQRDIKLRLLRHVSSSFHEDPLRVLRVARFAARFKNMGFVIAPETLKLMTDMTHELQELSPERVWMETKKALMTDNPQVYFQVLRQCGGLKLLFPELDMLFLSDNSKKDHSCVNTFGDDTMEKLYNISCLNTDLSIRFAILCCYLGQSLHYFPVQISNLRCIQYSKNLFVDQLCNRLKVPNLFYRLAKIVSTYYCYLKNFTVLSPEMVMMILNAFDCWRYPTRIEQILFIVKSHFLGCKKYQDYFYIQEKFLRDAFSVAMKVKVRDVITDGFVGAGIGKELYRRRLNNLQEWYKIANVSN